MRNNASSRYKNLRKRVRPLRPWIVGLNVPNIVSELADVKPFIYLCCKLSVTEQSWANMPEGPKALIVKDTGSLRLCDGQFWIDLIVDNSLQRLLVCKNQFRNRDVCFFIVFLDEYLINYDSNSQTFVSSVKDLRIVKDTHCLSEAFSSIPSIKSAEKDLLAVVLSPPSEEIAPSGSSSRSSNEDGESENSNEKSGSDAEIMDINPQPISITEESVQLSEPIISNEGSGSDAKKENNSCPSSPSKQDNTLPQEQSSAVDKWIPTQNPSWETLSFGDDIDNISVEDESDDTATSDRIPPTPQKTSNNHVIDGHNPLVERDLFHVSDLTSPNSDKDKLPTSGYSEDLHCANTSPCICTPQNNPLSRSSSSLFAPSYSPTSTRPRPQQELGTNFLTWLSTQEPTVEICYLEETARAIDELCKIEPAQPFSDYFNNFAFTE